LKEVEESTRGDRKGMGGAEQLVVVEIGGFATDEGGRKNE